MEAVDTSGRPFSLPSPTSPSLAAAAREDSNGSNSNTTSTTIPKKRPSKSHVPAACVNCQKAHLACEVARPCKRCVQSGREDTCFDVQHKKRGRPRRRDRQQNGSGTPSSLDESTYPSSSSPLSSAMAATVRSAGTLAPGLVRSSFSMTRPPGDQGGDKDPMEKTMITLILSMDVCCARVSDESLDLLGIYPHEFAHRSLYDFILPQHADRLARIHRCLLDNANRQEKRLPPTQRTTSECFSSTSPSLLTNIANGSLTLKEPLEFKTSNGSHIELQARFYLGGGLGSDLFVPSSLERLYIVCLATADQAPSQQQQQQQHISSAAPTPATLPSVVAPLQQHSHHHRQHHPLMITTSPPTITSTSNPVIAYHPDTVFNPTTAVASPTTTTTTTTSTSNAPITSLLEHTSIPPAVQALFCTSEPVTTTSATRRTTTAPAAVSGTSSHDIDYMLTHTTSSPIYSPASPSSAMLDDREIDTIAMQQQPSSSYSSPPRVLNTATTTTPVGSPSPSSSSLQEDDAASRTSRPVGTPRVKLPRPEDRLLAAAATEEDDRQRRRDSKDHMAWDHPREMYLRETTSSRLLSAQANSVMGSWFPYQSPSSAMVNAVKNTTPHPSTSSSLNPVATHHRIPSIHSRIPASRPFVQRR
ncbi:hypothetical protein BDB00DRAFT_935669 [Zychaea mexicana]|uniref:uncharacterized protein n=1 Tax=Zychaea mexicana TaxID=64656 RepID=UPI0022FEFB8B|nr:uncharacterized protein BDB00DRAFT_935669 [Zychaea mexicana]KAI9498511.1 hypothetical protein BDB00DRAFT_935669 [Zychaea mexicana]